MNTDQYRRIMLTRLQVIVHIMAGFNTIQEVDEMTFSLYLLQCQRTILVSRKGQVNTLLNQRKKTCCILEILIVLE